MSSKQKHKKANGFLMFMLDYKRKAASNGNEIDMNTAQLEAGALWMKMSPFEREKFGGKALSSKGYNEPKKYTSFGITFDEIDRQKEDERAKIQRMSMTIEEMLQIAEEQDSLKALPFYFFSTTEFVQTLHNDIFPAEIAMAKFCLGEGVTDTLHMMVNPGKLPLGMAADARIRADKVHRRQLPPHCDGEADYSVILDKMLAFMGIDMKSNKRPTFPPLFVEPGHKNEGYKAAKMTLDKITDEAGQHNIEFRLFQIEYLLQKLHNRCNERFVGGQMSLYMAQDIMSRETFIYSSIGCDFHNDLDVSHLCCLSKVQCWAFEISKVCNECDESLELIAGKHFPARAESESDVNDVVSSDARETAWGESISGISNSMKLLNMESSCDLDETSSSMPKLVPTVSGSSRVSNSVQGSAVNATFASTGGSESLHLAPSFSQLIRMGRGGKSLRGGRRSEPK